MSFAGLQKRAKNTEKNDNGKFKRKKLDKQNQALF